MSDLLVVGYYTDDLVYAQYYKRWRDSLQELGYESEAFVIADRGSWQANTQAKAEILYEFALNNMGRRCLYLDVDAVVLGSLDYFETLEADVGCHIRRARQELLSGTIYFQANERVIELFKVWEDENLTHGTLWEQRNLHAAIRKSKDIKFENIPPEYCFIFDLMQKEFPNVTPIIKHMQASREAKQRRRDGSLVCDSQCES